MTVLTFTGEHILLDSFARHITASTGPRGRAAMESTSVCTKRKTTHQERSRSFHITAITPTDHESEQLGSWADIISYPCSVTVSSFPRSPNNTLLQNTQRLGLRILSRRGPNHNTTSLNTPTSSPTVGQQHLGLRPR